MPLQNRVTPFGDIVAVPERGTMMGNRGILHDASGRILRRWAVKRWLVCVLEFRGRKRTVTTPGRYTELFFLDEATALAAGHRPCFECRRQSFNDFVAAWSAAHLSARTMTRPTADEIDARLHSERLAADRSKGTYTTSLDDLPDGVFVSGESLGDHPHLVLGTELLAWSHGCYRRRQPRPKGIAVRVLTPRATVAAIHSGYAPQIHPSARSPSIISPPT